MSESKGKRFVFDTKEGKFVEGKASPWLPPEHMRGLPSEWTTKEIAQNDKIHELDPPHIVQGIIEDEAKALQPKKAELTPALQALADSIAPLGARVPLNQQRVDLLRFKVIKTRVARVASSPTPEKALKELKVDYLFFPEDNVNQVELRSKREMPYPLPKHLRNLRLEIDIFNWPESVVDALRELGFKPPNFKEMWKDAERRAEISRELEALESVESEKSGFRLPGLPN